MDIFLIMVSSILGIIGLFCMIKPDNPLLPMLEFGDVINAQKYIEKNGKTKKLLLWMRVLGFILLLLSILLIVLYYK